MLKNIFLSFFFHRFCQSGFYFDFFLKKLCDVFIRNVLVIGYQFFGEKYMIEYFSKEFLNFFLSKFSYVFNSKFSKYIDIFLTFLIIFMYAFILLNLFLLI